ncbi:MAG: hypothetical protein WD184_03560 [Acidimicrobiia bacterium]
MSRRRKWMIVTGLVLAAVIALLQATKWAVGSIPAILGLLIALLVAASGIWPPGSRSKKHPAMGEPSMNDVANESWTPVGKTGHFLQAELPMSDEGSRLLGGGFRHILYAEFDTDSESDAWREFVYDPLKVLIAEGIIGATPLDDHHAHLHVTIYKLTGTSSDDADYLSRVTQRGELAAEIYRKASVPEGSRGAWHVATTVVNHEQPLNPRIGMTTVLV